MAVDTLPPGILGAWTAGAGDSALRAGVGLAVVGLLTLVASVGLVLRERWRARQERQAWALALAEAARLRAAGLAAAGVMHEVRNPLTGVLGFAQLGRAARTPEEMRSYLGLVERDAGRAIALLKEVLALGRPAPMRREPVAVNAVVEEALQLSLAPLRLEDVTLEACLDEAAPRVLGDATQLKQVLLNLVLNAVEAMRQAPVRVLQVSTWAGPQGVRLVVGDTGPGLSAAVQSRLFTPFFSTRPPGEGTGLGLSLSRTIVEAHGGRLVVDSQPGAGARFVVELPRLAEG